MVPSLKPSQLPTSLPSSEPTIKASSEPSEQPTPAPTPSPTIDYKLIASNAITEKGVDLSGNCQSQAINWLGNNAMLSSYTEQKMLQRFALAVIHCSTNSVKTVYTDYTYGEGNDIPGWTHSDGWMTDVDECSWHGISCDETGAVTGIDLTSNGLTGSIPDEITLLNGSLKHLDISHNIVANEKAQLEWIGQLDKLTHLDVHFNNFHDDGLPSGLQHLTDLHFLDISYCLFFGELDGAIFKDMQKLRYLEMGGNDYNSPMPSEIVDLPILEHLYIDNTHLTGDLNWLSHCHSKNLFEVWVDKNPGVVGTIPWLIGEITSIESLSISSCGLTGTVPTELADLTGMQQLWLFNNTLTGTIPSELASLTSMHTFHVEDNKLVGTMPDEICELRPPFGSNGILGALAADCEGSQPEVSCDCCTCCQSPCL